MPNGVSGILARLGVRSVRGTRPIVIGYGPPSKGRSPIAEGFMPFNPGDMASQRLLESLIPLVTAAVNP